MIAVKDSNGPYQRCARPTPMRSLAFVTGQANATEQLKCSIDEHESRSTAFSPEDASDNGKRLLLCRMLGFVFGHDFFISYSWERWAAHAAALATRLKGHGFEVFLDRADYASGDWKKVGARTLGTPAN